MIFTHEEGRGFTMRRLPEDRHMIRAMLRLALTGEAVEFTARDKTNMFAGSRSFVALMWGDADIILSHLPGPAFSGAINRNGGRVVSVQERDNACHFAATQSYSVYLEDARVSIWLLRFEGAELSGALRRADGAWAVPLTADTVAIATGDSRSLELFHDVLGEAFPELQL